MELPKIDPHFLVEQNTQNSSNNNMDWDEKLNLLGKNLFIVLHVKKREKKYTECR
jgi:hypothetical protein